jgi:hypothetical protein
MEVTNTSMAATIGPDVVEDTLQMEVTNTSE